MSIIHEEKRAHGVIIFKITFGAFFLQFKWLKSCELTNVLLKQLGKKVAFVTSSLLAMWEFLWPVHGTPGFNCIGPFQTCRKKIIKLAVGFRRQTWSPTIKKNWNGSILAILPKAWCTRTKHHLGKLACGCFACSLLGFSLSWRYVLLLTMKIFFFFLDWNKRVFAFVRQSTFWQDQNQLF